MLETCSLDDGLDFGAVLIVEWARRFDTTGFFEYVKALGYSIPESDRDNFAASAAMYFLATDFQLQGI